MAPSDHEGGRVCLVSVCCFHASGSLAFDVYPVEVHFVYDLRLRLVVDKSSEFDGASSRLRAGSYCGFVWPSISFQSIHGSFSSTFRFVKELKLAHDSIFLCHVMFKRVYHVRPKVIVYLGL